MCVCPQAAHTQEALEESVQMMKEAVDDLAATLSEAASAAGAVGGMVNSISQAINKMEDGPGMEPEGTFVDYQTTMVKTAKAIAVTVQEMVRTSAGAVCVTVELRMVGMGKATVAGGQNTIYAQTCTENRIRV